MTGGGGGDGYRALVAGAGLVDREVAVIEVAGPDAARFLHGQTTVDAEGLDVGAGAETLLLTPKGRLVAVGHLLRVRDVQFLFLVDRRTFEAAADRLVQFHLRVDCDVLADDELAVWSVLGPEADSAVGDAFGVVPPARPLSHVGVDADASWRLVRAGAGGIGGIHLVCGVNRPAVQGTVPVDADALAARRVELGVLLFGVDYDETTIPHDAGLVPRAVSLDKGCYVGQELIERIWSRGRPNRAPRRVRLSGDLVPAPGVAVIGPDGTPGGELTTTAWCPAWDAPGGLGLLRRDLPDGAHVDVAGVPGVVLAPVDATGV